MFYRDAMKLRYAFYISAIYLTSCNELKYEPAFTSDTAGAPGIDVVTQKTVYYPPPSTAIPYGPEDLTKTMSVVELLNIALFNNPSTRASWNAARAAAFGYHVSLSEYYPSLGYTGIITAQNNTLSTGSSTTNIGLLPGTPLQQNGVTAVGVTTRQKNIYTILHELNMTYLLLDFGGRDANAMLALQTLYAANWTHNYTLQQVMLSVLTNYTAWLGNKGLVEADTLNVKDAEVAVKAAQVMHRAGLATLTDELQAQTLLEQAKTNLETAKGAEKTSFAQLMVALGLPADTQISIQNLPTDLPFVAIAGDVTSLIEIAKARQPDLGAAVAAVKEQEAQLAISFSAGMPTITTNGSLSRLHFIRTPNLDGHQNSINLTLNVPLFEGFFYINQQKQLRAQIQEALANLDVQVSLVSAQVATNFYAFQTAVAVLPSTEATLDFGQRAYNGFLSQYKVGTSSIIDVLNSLTTLSSARAQVVIARTNWASSLANLAFSVGMLGALDSKWVSGPPKDLYKLPITDDQKTEALKE